MKMPTIAKPPKVIELLAQNQRETILLILMWAT
jgi:hypothetical protein